MRTISVVLLALAWVHSSLSLTCPVPTIAGTVTRNKTCPDFKANPEFTYCCTSKLPPTSTQAKEKHGFYCCSLTDFEKEKDEIASAELKSFLKDYLALMIFGTVLVISLAIIFMAMICKRIPGCPMYRNSQTMTYSSDQSTSAMYRPVDTIPPKMYEAPPPYERFVPPPPATPRSNDGSEWNCIIENEVGDDLSLDPCSSQVNGSRRTPPQIQ